MDFQISDAPTVCKTSSVEPPQDKTSSATRTSSTVRVPYFQLQLSDRDIESVTAVMRKGWLGMGPQTAAFEAAFSTHQGGGEAVATNSCTSALHTALAALGVGRGDGVLISTHAWISAAEAIANCEAIPIFVDCHAADQSIDLEDAARKLAQARTGRLPQAKGRAVPVKGLISIYYAGLVGDEQGTRRFADAHGLWFLADAAHSMTAEWADDQGRWHPCGAGLADVYCYSFYPNKTMTTGDGGMIVTGDGDLAERMRRIRNHGLSFDTWEGESRPSWDRCVTMRGYKYTMTDMEAALGLSQMEHVDHHADLRRAIAKRYRDGLRALPGLELLPDPANRRSSHHLFPVRLAGRGGHLRNEAIRMMRAREVDCRVHWRPLHVQPYFEDHGWREEDCPQSSQSWQELVSLPIFPSMTSRQVDHVIRSLKFVLNALPEGSHDGHIAA